MASCPEKAQPSSSASKKPPRKVPEPRPTNEPAAQETWPLTLRDAIRIALDNNEIVRVISLGVSETPIGGCGPTPPIVIARVNPHANFWRFKAEVMALVRSVEQQYWNLAQVHVQLSSAQQAVKTAQEVLTKEQSDLAVGRGTVADVAEAAQRLEQFNLDLVTRTSDVITTERQLRNILGLPPADNRRIIPVTPALEARLEPDWDACLNEMSQQQPDIVQAKLGMGPPVTVVVDHGPDHGRPAAPPCSQMVEEREHEQNHLQQLTHERTHMLVRCFLEIDANYKQFRTAARLRAAAAQRLDAQRAYYEEGRITLDRFLDAVSQHATAVATESQYKATYNIYVAALGEAKGTLLADCGIVVAESIPGQSASQQPATGKKDHEAQLAALVVPAKIRSATSSQPKADAPTKPACAAMCCQEEIGAAVVGLTPQPKSWNFSISIGGAQPIQIKGTISASDPDATTP
jgi:hypothetical protein